MTDTAKQQDVNDKISASWLQIEREKSQLIAAINGLTVGFMITDDHNNIVTSNPKAEEILGRKSSSWDLHEIQKNIKSDDFNLTRASNDCLTSKQNIESETVEYNGKFLKFRLTPIEILKGGLATLGTTIIIEDTTTEKIKDDKQIDFLSIATHQIKAPLTIIRSDTELILKFYPDLLKDKNFQTIVSEIQAEAQRAISITHDFLDIVRLEEGRIRFKKEIFDIKKIAEEVATSFQTIAKIKGIYLKVESKNPNLPLANADPDGARHILFNLVDNALKFTRLGGITISLEALAEFINIRVIDTGSGLSANMTAKLFQKFTAEESQKSSGLGLYIAKLFTETMGGKIKLEKTAEGKGSTFLFTIPVENPKSGSITVTFQQ